MKRLLKLKFKIRLTLIEQFLIVDYRCIQKFQLLVFWPFLLVVQHVRVEKFGKRVNPSEFFRLPLRVFRQIRLNYEAFLRFL